jgi:hypothetical protein
MAIYKLEGKREASIKTYIAGSKVGNIMFYRIYLIFKNGFNHRTQFI